MLLHSHFKMILKYGLLYKHFPAEFYVNGLARSWVWNSPLVVLGKAVSKLLILNLNIILGLVYVTLKRYLACRPEYISMWGRPEGISRRAWRDKQPGLKRWTGGLEYISMWCMPEGISMGPERISMGAWRNKQAGLKE